MNIVLLQLQVQCMCVTYGKYALRKRNASLCECLIYGGKQRKLCWHNVGMILLEGGRKGGGYDHTVDT